MIILLTYFITLPSYLLFTTKFKLFRYTCTFMHIVYCRPNVNHSSLGPPTLPSWSLLPQNISLVEDNAATLRCACTGNPEPFVYWEKVRL